MDIIQSDSIDISEYSEDLVRKLIEQIVIVSPMILKIKFVGGYETEVLVSRKKANF